MTTSRTEPSGKPGEVPARDWAAVVAGVLAVIGLLVLSWRHADLRTSAIVLLGLALACGLAAVLIGWGPYYLARRRAITSDRPPRSKAGAVVVLGIICVFAFTVGVLVSPIRAATVNCKALKRNVMKPQNRALWPTQSREEKRCHINQYIIAVDKGQVPQPNKH